MLRSAGCCCLVQELDGDVTEDTTGGNLSKMLALVFSMEEAEVANIITSWEPFFGIST